MPLAFKQLIESIAGGKAPGPSTSFTIFHIIYALELTAEKPIGRNKLASKMNVGEGAIRTIIRRLKDEGLIVSSKEGCSITNKGLRVWEEFQTRFPKRIEFNRNVLANSEYNFVYLVRNRGDKVESGIEQRDAAIITGAKKVTVVVSKQGNLIIDSVSENLEEDYPAAAKLILKHFEPLENDVIIIAGADSLLKAKKGAFAASWTLIEAD